MTEFKGEIEEEVYYILNPRDKDEYEKRKKEDEKLIKLLGIV